MNRFSVTPGAGRFAAPVVTDRLPDPVPGEHLFVLSLTYEVRNPAQGNFTADHENLLRVSGPACHWCGASTADQAREPCPGPG